MLAFDTSILVLDHHHEQCFLQICAAVLSEWAALSVDSLVGILGAGLLHEWMTTTFEMSLVSVHSFLVVSPASSLLQAFLLASFRGIKNKC